MTKTSGDWRARILRAFVPQLMPLTLVADPDGLLTEEQLVEAIRARGFDILEYEEPIAFRFAYESRFSRGATLPEGEGGRRDLVVRFSGPESELQRLPYDLLARGRCLSFSLADLFPSLSYPVVTELDRADLDEVYRVQAGLKQGPLGDSATRDLVLRHVFGIVPELIVEGSDLLRVLLRRHHSGRKVPESLDGRFIELLRHRGLFDDWPLERIVPDREAFLVFLQERWSAFLDRTASECWNHAGDEQPQYHFKFAGPRDLPFSHDDVRVYMDNLFAEGLLHPVEHRNASLLATRWTRVGVRYDPLAEKHDRCARLLESVTQSLPVQEARHGDWMHLAQCWAELLALRVELGSSFSPEAVLRFEQTRGRIDASFSDWLLRRYAGLYNQPAQPPVMLHQIPRVMARGIAERGAGRAALIVVDGLAMDQWVVLREVLHRQRPDLLLREGAVFAWIPTTTAVSRQAAFSGKVPLFFPDSIATTDKESAAWTRFWCEHGLVPRQVGYVRSLGIGDAAALANMTENRTLRVLGLVIDTVDKIMHGMKLGSAGMHNQVRQWAEHGFLGDLIDSLVRNGYLVYLTSDHGNIEAVGIGRPNEGAVADLRGERVRVYPDDRLRGAVHARFPQTLKWPAWGLPDDYRPLLPIGRTAFVNLGEVVVCHGGIAIEEVLVPLVEIERVGA
jgi:hypothetical protein